MGAIYPNLRVKVINDPSPPSSSSELTGQNWTREWGGCLTHLAAPALGVWEARTLEGEEVGKEGVFVLCTFGCVWAEPPSDPWALRGPGWGEIQGKPSKPGIGGTGTHP